VASPAGSPPIDSREVRTPRRSHRVVACVGAALAVVSLGVSSTVSAGPVRAAGNPTTLQAVRSQGVAPRALSPGDHTITLLVGGRVRSLILHVPPDPPVAHRPLLLIFHGITDTAQSTEQGTDFSQVADQTGEVVAYLQGYEDSWNEQAGGTPAALAHVNDVAYTTAVIKLLERIVVFAHQRIVAVGFSNGALMVEDLGCRIAQELEYVIPVEGELAASTSSTCRPARPLSVYEIHGTADTAILYNGGLIEGHTPVVLSAPASVARWAHLDRCSTPPATSDPSSSIKLTTYARCQKHSSVVLRTIIGGVHQWEPDIGEVVASVLFR
jgi:polyhydroxybutyrate depolymerase